MTQDQKRQSRFVKDLSNTIVKDLTLSIRKGKVPDNWDGHELRCLLAHRFEQSAQMSVIRGNPRSARAKDFRNTVLVNNL